jgi:HPt (histidine-containing phosphotransfer) domain-containing protein
MNGHIGKPVRIGDLDAALKDLLHRPGKVAALDSSSLNPLPSSGESTTAVVYNDVVLEELLADLGGDEAMGTDLIQSFLLDNRQRFTAILSAGDAGDLDALAFQAHAIKSASAMIGLLALSEVAGEIEAAANEAPDEVDVGLQASRLAAECHRASEVLNALLLTPPG